MVGFKGDVGERQREVLFGVVHHAKGTAAQSWRTVCDTHGLGLTAAFPSFWDIVPCRVTVGRR